MGAGSSPQAGQEPAEAAADTRSGARPLPPGAGPDGDPGRPASAYASPPSAHVPLDVTQFTPERDRLAVRRDGHVVEITLADPDRRNMMGMEMTAAWDRLMAGLRSDGEVRAVLLTGAGSAFSSGGNTSWIGADSHAGVALVRERMLSYYRTWLAIRELPVPTIAAVNGPAIGAGAALALACDIRWAGESASLSVPFLRLGMHPGMLTTHLLPQVAGVAVARDLIYTGRRVSATEMAAMALVTRILPDGELMAAARQVAQQVAAGAPLATRLTKSALDAAAGPGYAAAMSWEGLAQAVTLVSEDLIEGLAAARERRVPDFKCR